jgi:hypothetical protein
MSQEISSDAVMPGDTIQLILDEAGSKQVTLRFADGAIVETHIDRNNPLGITAGEQSIVVQLDDVEHSRDI